MNKHSRIERIDALLDRKRKPRWKRRRWLAAAVALVVALALLARFVLGRGGSATEAYALQELRRQDLVIAVTATGNLRATRQIDIGSETSGLVAEVLVDNNDRIRRGQPLARLDTRRLENSLREAEAALAQARTQVDSADATAADSRDQLARQRQVYRASGGEVPSTLELNQSVQALRRAQAQSRSARAQVEQAAAQVATARTNLAIATIYSPVSGTVLQRRIEPGQTVAASFETPVLFTIAEDLSRMRLDVKVDEADIGRVRPGQQASFRVDAYPGEMFPAVIERVDQGSSSSTSTASSTTASTTSIVSYTARLRVANDDGRLRPGMTATAIIVTERVTNEFVVPLAALRFQPPAAAPGGLSVPRPPGQQGSGAAQEARIGRGSRQRIWVLNSAGRLEAVEVTTVAVSGSSAAVMGAMLRAGLRVATGTLGPRP